MVTKKTVVELKPIKESTEDYDRLEKEIRKIFRKEIYLPLLQILGEPSNTIKNSEDELLDAIRTGRIAFSRGKFTGRFRAAVSRELRSLGARWDRRQGSWNIPQSSLPMTVRMAIVSSKTHFEEKLAKIDKKLTKMLPEEISGKVQASSFFDATLWKVEKEFKASVKSITVAPQLTEEQRKRIADEWQTNIRLYIRDFTQGEIEKLRKDVQSAVFAGNRYESAVKTIQESYGVSVSKAKFLARQETSLLMAKFKQTRYEDAGVNWYKWKCVHNPKDKTPGEHVKGNVRYSHGVLDGKVFRWDNPPITTDPGEATRRNNPGQDYNCRCFAIPLVGYSPGKDQKAG